jgi:hypothetical protein
MIKVVVSDIVCYFLGWLSATSATIHNYVMEQ